MPKPLIQSTGRRKQAVARVRLRTGEGKITVNGRDVEDYFPSATHRMILSEPLRLTQTDEMYDIDATIHGGGITGQAGALRLGIARALIELDPELRARCSRRPASSPATPARRNPRSTASRRPARLRSTPSADPRPGAAAPGTDRLMTAARRTPGSAPTASAASPTPS